MNTLSKGESIMFMLGQILYDYNASLTDEEDVKKGETNIAMVLAYTLKMDFEEFEAKLRHDSFDNLVFMGYVDRFVRTDFEDGYSYYLDKFLEETGQLK